MTVSPPWPGEFPAAASQPSPAGSAGQRPFGSLLGIAQLGPARYPPLTLRFSVGATSLAVVPSGGNAEQLAQRIRGEMRRGRIGYDLQPLSAPRVSPYWSYSYRPAYTFGPLQPSEVLGYPGFLRAIEIRPRYRRRILYRVIQRYAIAGPYGLVVTAPAEQVDYDLLLGTASLYPAPPPVITPVVALPGVSAGSVHEMLVMDAGNIRLTAMVVPGQVPSSTDQFAQATLTGLRALSPDLAADNWQPDVFLGGIPCLRTTLLRGGGNSLIRSEFCWAGAAGGRGFQILVAGTKSIIRLEDALPLRDSVVLLPSH